jgi:uncharacterized protein YqeY
LNIGYNNNVNKNNISRKKEVYTMAVTKVTKRDNFNSIIKVLADAGRDDLVEVIEHEIELLNKKHGKVSKADIQRKADNAELQTAILAVLDKPMTASEIANVLSTDEVQYSNQKVSAMLRQLGDKVTKEVVKGKSYFSIVA